MAAAQQGRTESRAFGGGGVVAVDKARLPRNSWGLPRLTVEHHAAETGEEACTGDASTIATAVRRPAWSTKSGNGSPGLRVGHQPHDGFNTRGSERP